MPMKAKVGPVASLLFTSGMCALVFQVAWFREFRLVFGASTAAGAAVTAIFMAGLGLGNAVLGRRADRQSDPLAFYARLELGVAVSAALSPLLVDVARAAYVALGGQLALGFVGATAIRLALAALAIGLPTFLMGGTLPAAARAVTTPTDENRRAPAILYGMNTLGAVLGALVSTFFAIELLGTRSTLWLAASVNLALAVTAWRLARSCACPTSAPISIPAKPQRARRGPRVRDTFPAEPPPRTIVYAAAAGVGFAFFVMELVWYRMLGPLLGGSTFTFGLILAVALFGIGVGGAAYAWLFARRRPTLDGLALTCGLEAVCMAVPFALGDRVALWTAWIQQTHAASFGGEVFTWTVIASAVILPAALVSGIQFPLLIALLGRADDQLGRQIGVAVAFNTVGSILGSLAGGFGLLPLLSAPGVWRAVVLLLTLLSVALLLQSWWSSRILRRLMPGAACALLALVAAASLGPSAVWRHSSIGAGRAQVPGEGTNALRKWMNELRSQIVWQRDGVESSVAIARQHGLTFLVNGKSDGSALGDAATQIMLGLVPGTLHPHPRAAFVIGLGTGETAGWLAAMPSVERVDVVELEPAVEEMARRCRAINFDALAHPKVSLILNDAREVLLTSKHGYDLIISEPSNPYRSGVAGLFTREFYLAGRQRLNPGGIFAQWVQGYEVDARTVRMICATLGSVYAHVEIWQSSDSDLLLLAAAEPIAYAVPELRRRVGEEPLRTALACAWRAVDLEGFLARYIGGPQVIERYLAEEPARWNTDDRNSIEYGFARSLGQRGQFPALELRRIANEIQGQRPPTAGGQVDWQSVARQWREMYALRGRLNVPAADASPSEQGRCEALAAVAKRDFSRAIELWQSREPQTPTELAFIAWALAELGDGRAEPLVKRLQAYQPTEADAVTGILQWRQRKVDASAEALARAFRRLRTDPWPLPEIMTHAMETSLLVAATNRALAPALFAALEQPFAVDYADGLRRRIACRMAAMFQRETAVRCLEAFEPDVPWTRSFLKLRQQQYAAAGHQLAQQAGRDIDDFARQATKEDTGRE
jgi:predicted membrane-bound spermidine synthase